MPFSGENISEDLGHRCCAHTDFLSHAGANHLPHATFQTLPGACWPYTGPKRGHGACQGISAKSLCVPGPGKSPGALQFVAVDAAAVHEEEQAFVCPSTSWGHSCTHCRAKSSWVRGSNKRQGSLHQLISKDLVAYRLNS